MSEKSQELPFKQLGEKLKVIRQKLHETMSDVSGAVEIDESALERFEQGKERPSEDILNLMISHFGMQDDDAANLWQLAGYDPRSRDDDASSDEAGGNRAGVLVMAIDPRIIYTDTMHVNAAQNGVVLSFAQTAGSANQPLVTARVGMSREQARSVISTLQAALDKTEPRQLPAGQKTTSEADKKQSEKNESA